MRGVGVSIMVSKGATWPFGCRPTPWARGRQSSASAVELKQNSDLTIATARLVFAFPLGQTESFLRFVFSLVTAELEAPDHTTLSRRSAASGASLVSKQGRGAID